VVITARWDSETVGVTILDDGPGLAPEILDRIGEPYLTHRGKGRGRRAVQGEDPGEEKSGLGLGVFIAKTLLQRSGARITYRNRPGLETGTAVEVVWPRSVFSGPPATIAAQPAAPATP